MHADTAKFVRESQLATSEEVGLSKIMKVIKNLQVMPTIKVMLHKIINNALYVGKVAHDYQVRCKSVQSDNIIACVLHTHLSKAMFPNITNL